MSQGLVEGGTAWLTSISAVSIRSGAVCSWPSSPAARWAASRSCTMVRCARYSARTDWRRLPLGSMFLDGISASPRADSSTRARVGRSALHVNSGWAMAAFPAGACRPTLHSQAPQRMASSAIACEGSSHDFQASWAGAACRAERPGSRPPTARARRPRRRSAGSRSFGQQYTAKGERTKAGVNSTG